jgi:hypothetical protein
MNCLKNVRFYSRLSFSFDTSKSFQALSWQDKRRAIVEIHEQNLKTSRPVPTILNPKYFEYLAQSQTFVHLHKRFEYKKKYKV